MNVEKNVAGNSDNEVGASESMHCLPQCKQQQSRKRS